MSIKSTEVIRVPCHLASVISAICKLSVISKWKISDRPWPWRVHQLNAHPSRSRKLLSKLSPLHLSMNNSKFLEPSVKNFPRIQQRKLTRKVYFSFKLLNLAPEFYSDCILIWTLTPISSSCPHTASWWERKVQGEERGWRTTVRVS